MGTAMDLKTLPTISPLHVDYNRYGDGDVTQVICQAKSTTAQVFLYTSNRCNGFVRYQDNVFENPLVWAHHRRPTNRTIPAERLRCEPDAESGAHKSSIGGDNVAMEDCLPQCRIAPQRPR
jgi:hypothetical protein